jgi:hypothetical protein
MSIFHGIAATVMATYEVGSYFESALHAEPHSQSQHLMRGMRQSAIGMIACCS